MKTITKFLLPLTMTLIGSISVANASTDPVTYNFSLVESGNLQHGKYYIWNTVLSEDDTEYLKQDDVSIKSASISFNQIQNKWDYDLWVHLLEGSDTGTWWASYKDNEKGQNSEFDTWVNSPEIAHFNSDKSLETNQDVNYGEITSSPQDITYELEGTELTQLLNLAKDGSFGLGFDPDCHFSHDGITLSFTASTNSDAVPEPSTMLLFGTGIAGLAGLARKKRK